jgi:hypothetical protein
MKSDSFVPVPLFYPTTIRWSRRLALLFALLTLILLLSSISFNPGRAYLEAFALSYGNLLGQGAWSDIAQDYYGLHAVLDRSHAYAPIGELMPGISSNWHTEHPSTHPPTAFLLTAPIVLLPYPAAVAVWSALMLLIIPISVRIFGLSLRWAVLSLFFALFWPPAFTAFGHITPLWLFGSALAFRFRNTSPGWSGAGIAIASFTKYFPALLLLPHLRARRWQAVIVFTLLWLAALGVLIALHPAIIGQYLAANRIAAPETITRIDNGALFIVLHRAAGLPGLLLAMLLLASLSLWLLATRTSTWLWTSWLAVALLPVAWVYSLLALLPLLLMALRSRRWMNSAFAIFALLLPLITFSPSSVALAIVAAGLALVGLGSEQD